MGDAQSRASTDEAAAMKLAREMARAGLPPEAIIAELTARGVNPGIAAFVVHQHSGAPERARRGEGRIEMLVGGVICLLGAGLTIASYLDASGPAGGRFFILYGAIFVGGAQFLRGLVKWFRGME